MDRRPVALDHNFPEPILRVLDQHLKAIELVWVRDIDEALPTLDDDALIHALARHGHTVLVTSDYHMVDNPAVLVALHLTRVTLFAIEKAGHDPLVATGVLLKDLLPALRKGSPRGQVFRTRPAALRPTPAFDLLARYADDRGTQPQVLIDRFRPTA
jgi:hypothetical protein